MKHLKSISILFILLSACKVHAPSAKQVVPQPFIIKAEKSLIYRAAFDYKDYHFSGLCIFKEVGNDNIRIVFLNEMGITFMDFELSHDALIVHKMIDQLDKEILLNFVENDFRQLLMTDLFKPKKVRYKNNDEYLEFFAKDNLKVSYYQDKESDNIVRSERKGLLGMKSAAVKYKYEKSAIPKEIILTHRQVKMNLKLTLLEKI